jgi:type IV pilus assembly protein PilX
MRQFQSPYAQRGVSLLLTLVLILGVLVIAVMSVSGNVVSERASANSRDTDIAFQSAEAGLRAGEKAARLLTGAADGSSDCSSAVPGVCYLADNSFRLSATAWNGLTIAQAVHCPGATGCASATTASMLDSTPAITLAAGSIANVARQPSYLIEVLPSTTPGEESQRVTWMYRITSKGWGRSIDTQIVLQSVYYPVNG